MVWEQVADVIREEDMDALKAMKHSLSSEAFRDIKAQINEHNVRECERVCDSEWGNVCVCARVGGGRSLVERREDTDTDADTDTHSHRHTHSRTHTHTHTYSLSHTHTHTLSLSLTPTLLPLLSLLLHSQQRLHRTRCQPRCRTHTL